MRKNAAARTLRIGLATLAGVGASALIAPAAWGSPVDNPGASSDLSHVFFRTAEQMVPADTDSVNDVYERSGGTTKLISAPGAGASGAPQAASFAMATPDGSSAFFTTTESLVAADTDAALDVYKRAGGVTTLVSAAGVGASGPTALTASPQAVIPDGSRVYFVTQQNMVAADTDGLQDIYERSGGATTLVSVPDPGGTPPPAAMNFRRASTNGAKVFFETTENLVASDTDGLKDIYERSGGTTTLVSAPGVGNTPPAADVFFAGMSSDGAKVFLQTTENLVAADTDGLTDDYERSAGTTTLVSEPGAGATPPAEGIFFQENSNDGSRVFFETDENLVAADTDGLNDIYEHSSGATTLASAPGIGASGSPDSMGIDFINADGTHVFFTTSEKLVAADTDANEDIYQRFGGATTLISTPGIGAFGPSEDLIMRGVTPDGSQVFFDSDQSLVGEDTDGGLSDVWEHSVGFTTLVSAPTTGVADPASPASFFKVSTDGTRALFTSSGRFTGSDLDSDTDIYQRSGGVTTIVSADSFPPETTITAAPKPKLTAKKKTVAASFSFSSSEPSSSFQCRLDGAAFSACTSPKALQVKPGSHTFQVRALDSYANADTSPATGTLKVVKKKRKKRRR